MKKIIVLLFVFTTLFSFENKKIENLMGENNFKTYNALLSKIFIKNDYTIYEILSKLKNNGLLELFFDKAKVIHTKFIFKDGKNILNTKILNDSLVSLGYAYFYPSEMVRKDNKLILDIEFQSEHYIDPVSLIDELNSRGCKVLDVYKQKEVFNYVINCNKGIIKEIKPLKSKNLRYINANGVYWLENNDFRKIIIKTKKIDYWHPSVWFYDKNLNLLNNKKINKKTVFLTLKIPAGCKYIKITDIYSAENFKRGIIVKGLK